MDRPFSIFPAIITFLWELVISNMHNKFEHNTWKNVKVIALKSQIIDEKCKMSH